MRKGLAVGFLSLLVAIISPVHANLITACNSTGHSKQSYYDNETVYVCGNFTAPDDTAEVYIMAHRTFWANNTVLANISLGYKVIQGNSSGGIPVTLLWPTPDVGSYDLIADADKNGIYNSTADSVDNFTVPGFTVLESAEPTLTFVLGGNHPESHDCNLNTDWEHNPMMQINVSNSEHEDVRIDSMAITAFGSGDEEEDITVVYLIEDINGSGTYDSGDALIAYSNYLRNDGAVFFDMSDGYIISADRTVTLLITYSMSTSGRADDTYRFDLITVASHGRNTGKTANINGLPLGSAIKTISQEHVDATTTTVPGPTTTILTSDECETDEECGGTICTNKRRTGNRCVIGETSYNYCIDTTVSVECCNDNDCVEGYYCLNYECVEEVSGGDKTIIWTIIIIIVVVAAVVALFLFIRNKKRPPEGGGGGQGSSENEEWSLLKKKWQENK
jgi:hypothetical protein